MDFNINIQRIIQDGLDIEKNFLEHVELQRTQKLSNIANADLRKLLETFYNGEGGLVYLASLINSVISQEKVTFYLDYRVMSRLVREDPNVQARDLSSFMFKMFLEKVTRGGFIKHLGGDEGETTHVYTIIHPDLLKYFYRTLGKEAIAEQRSYVVQYVKGLKEFQNSPASDRQGARGENEVQAFLRNLSHEENRGESTNSLEETPPQPPVELPVKATSRKSSSKKLEERPESISEKDIQAMSDLLAQEVQKMKMFKERARMAESCRLSQSDDPQLTQQAVLYATEFKQQEKKVMELELEFLKLKERAAQAGDSKVSAQANLVPPPFPGSC